jgi:hypothetical protein
MITCACEEGDACRGVGFVGFEVKKYADCADGDAFDEVDVEVVGLWSI